MGIIFNNERNVSKTQNTVLWTSFIIASKKQHDGQFSVGTITLPRGGAGGVELPSELGGAVQLGDHDERL